MCSTPTNSGAPAIIGRAGINGHTDQAAVRVFVVKHLTDVIPAGSVLRLPDVSHEQHGYYTQTTHPPYTMIYAVHFCEDDDDGNNAGALEW